MSANAPPNGSSPRRIGIRDLADDVAGLRIACVISSMQPGGAERVMSLLCNDLADHGARVTLITLAAPDASDFYALDPPVERRFIGRGFQGGGLSRVLRIVGYVRGLRRCLHDIRPDVVVSFVDMTNIITLLASRTLAVPVIVSERVDPAAHVHRLSRMQRRLRRLTYKWADRVVAQTARAARGIDFATPAKVVTIPNPISPPAVPPHRHECHEVVIAIGRLDPQKGFDILIEAFAQIADRFPTWILQIYGQGPLHGDLLERIRKLGLEQRVSLMGVTAAIHDVLSRADIMAFPSRYEGFPNALAEAMAHGLAPIALEGVSGVEDLIQHGKTGLLASNERTPGDHTTVTAFAEQLATLMASPDIRVTIGSAAAEHVQKYAPEIVLAEWRVLISRVQTEASNGTH